MAAPEMAPITFAAGSIGNEAPISVSPQHRMLIRDARTQLYFGEEEVLVAAKHLVNGRDVIQGSGGAVTYHHILFDQHEIVFSNGVQSESYHPGATSLPGLDPRARSELLELFPELRANPIAYGPAARVSVRGQHGRLLAA
ncbi:MAG: hypothetical protein HKN63_03930 [Rhodobacteraceae bacterium]|nr:hypothetical protein [Paracoccaceae bacterium]